MVFTQLPHDFDVQEHNWRRAFLGRGYLSHLWWNGCATGKMQEAFRKEVFVIDEARVEIARLDADAFDELVNWLTKEQREVYIAHIASKVVKAGKCVYVNASDATAKQSLLGISRFKYESILHTAIASMKRHGGLV